MKKVIVRDYEKVKIIHCDRCNNKFLVEQGDYFTYPSYTDDYVNFHCPVCNDDEWGIESDEVLDYVELIDRLIEGLAN